MAHQEGEGVGDEAERGITRERYTGSYETGVVSLASQYVELQTAVKDYVRALRAESGATTAFTETLDAIRGGWYGASEGCGDALEIGAHAGKRLFTAWQRMLKAAGIKDAA